MHDWQEIIREMLAGVRVSRSRRESLVEELANHMEDLHAELLASGFSDEEAFMRCCEQLQDTQIAAIAKHIQQEGIMNSRSKTLWLPGLVTLTLSSVSLMVLQLFAFSRPRVLWIDGGSIPVGITWLIALLPCGALGAYLSRHAGGTRLRALTASLFPALIMLAVFSVFLPIAIFIERNAYVLQHPRYFGLALLAWTFVPGAALLLGGLIVLGMRSTDSQHQSDSPRPVA